MKEAFQFLYDTLDAYPNDPQEIEKTVRFMVIWFKKRVAEKQFKRLNKHDIERIWDTEKKNIRRLYGNGNSFGRKNGK